MTSRNENQTNKKDSPNAGGNQWADVPVVTPKNMDSQMRFTHNKIDITVDTLPAEDLTGGPSIKKTIVSEPRSSVD